MIAHLGRDLQWYPIYHQFQISICTWAGVGLSGRKSHHHPSGDSTDPALLLIAGSPQPPTIKQTVCYWKWTIYRWFTHYLIKDGDFPVRYVKYVNVYKRVYIIMLKPSQFHIRSDNFPGDFCGSAIRRLIWGLSNDEVQGEDLMGRAIQNHPEFPAIWGAKCPGNTMRFHGLWRHWPSIWFVLSLWDVVNLGGVAGGRKWHGLITCYTMLHLSLEVFHSCCFIPVSGLGSNQLSQ